MNAVLRRHPLTSYFIFVNLFSWTTWLALLYILPPDIAWVAIPLGIIAGPTLVAFAITSSLDGQTGVRALLRRYTLWRAGVGWYLVALFGMPCVMILELVGVSGLAALKGAPVSTMPLPWVALSSFTQTFVFGGPLFEEPGWRGFALPRLQSRQGPFVGSIILGLFWGLWHVPLVLLGVYQTTGLQLAAYTLINLPAAAIIFTWVFNRTNGSLLMTVLLHTSINTTVYLLRGAFPPLASALSAIFPLGMGINLAALALVVATRGRLGYRPLPHG